MSWPPPPDEGVGVLDLERGEHGAPPSDGTATVAVPRPEPGSRWSEAGNHGQQAHEQQEAAQQETAQHEAPFFQEEHETPSFQEEEVRRGPHGPAFAGGLTPERIALVLLAALVLVEGVFLLRQRFERTAAKGPPATVAAQTAAQTAADPARLAGAPEVSPSVPVASSGVAGQLTVRTEPAGAEVTVDGNRRGKAPLTVSELGPGDHEVVIRHPQGTLRQRVQVAAGQTTTLVVPLAPSAPPTPPAAREGTLAVRAPIEVRVFEGDRLVGTSAMERLRLDRGSHRLQFRNEEVGFEQARTVTIAPGRTTTLSLDLPQQRVALNATPWAEVLVDGKPAGETPIGSLRLALGPHTIVFRHPQLGEKSMRVMVKAGEPVRLSVDMRKQ